jgi:hypothetical protein
VAKGRKGKQITHFAVKRRIEDVIGSDVSQIGRPLVISGNDSPGGAKRRELVVQRAPTVSVRDNLLRIQEEADPLGFLIAVQQGDLIPVTYVSDDGHVVTEYHQAGLDQRIGVAKFLAAKVLPTLSVTKHVMAPPADPSTDEYDPSNPGQTNKTFAQIVQDAALRRRQAKMMDVELGDMEYVEAQEADSGGGAAEAGEGASRGRDPGQAD